MVFTYYYEGLKMYLQFIMGHLDPYIPCLEAGTSYFEGGRGKGTR
jgi:hypothetical protein